MAREYSTEELHRKLTDRADRFYLIDTLPHDSYVNRHLPGALSLPLEELAADAAEVIPEKDVEVITYCASPR
jgi:rhodanese-related sulfurtransferase